MAPPDQFALAKWEKHESEPHIVARFLRGIWYNYLPDLRGKKVSLLNLPFATVRLAFLSLMAPLPIWAKLRESSDSGATLSWGQAIGGTVLICAGLSYNFLYDRVRASHKEKSVRRQLLKKLSLHLSGVIANLAPLVKLRNADCRAEAGSIRKKVLECIRRVAEIHLADLEGVHLEATLLVFDDPACSQMKILDRTTAERPTGKIVVSNETMAYYVAKSRKHRAVCDFLKDAHPFPKAGLSLPEPPYRSILMIPLLDTSTGSPDGCFGVVSIDSARPYHFWPGAGDDLVLKVRPYCNWLSLLLTLSLDQVNALRDSA
jgi:hypothetical protein